MPSKPSMRMARYAGAVAVHCLGALGTPRPLHKHSFDTAQNGSQGQRLVKERTSPRPSPGRSLHNTPHESPAAFLTRAGWSSVAPLSGCHRPLPHQTEVPGTSTGALQCLHGCVDTFLP